MKGFQRIGDYLAEFFVITLMVIVACVTVVGFFPLLVGLTAFFQKNIDMRRFKDIFVTIKVNWRIIICYTLFQLVMIIFSVLNIFYFNTHTDNMNGFVLGVSYVALVVALFYVATAPTIIVHMNVSFFQLLRNGIMLLFGNLWYSMVSLALIAGVMFLVLYSPYFVILTLYIVPYFLAVLMHENFYRLKARVLKTPVQQLKQSEQADDYLDEYGNINREERPEQSVTGNADLQCSEDSMDTSLTDKDSADKTDLNKQ